MANPDLSQKAFPPVFQSKTTSAALDIPIFSSADIAASTSLPPLVGTHRCVINISASAIVSSNYHANNNTVIFGNKAGIGVAFQESSNALAGIVNAVTSHILAGKPQTVNRSVIIYYHFSDFHFIRPFQQEKQIKQLFVNFMEST